MGVRTYADGVLLEEWNDVTRTYRRFNGGQVVESRDYTEDEAALLVAAEQVVADETVRVGLRAKAQAALAANQNDVTQDGLVITQAQAVVDSTATSLTQPQLIAVLKDLARGLVVLAGNDVNAKRELQALVLLVLDKLDDTTGT